MAFPLTLPAIGSTNWGNAVNNNWTTLNNAFPIGVLSVSNGGTGLSTITAGQIPFGNGTSALSTSAQLVFSTSNGLTANRANASGSECFGYNAGNTSMTGTNNTCVGNTAGNSITTGSENTVIGWNAGTNITTGNSNVCIGSTAGYFSTSSDCVYIGDQSGSYSTGGNNVSVGASAFTGGFGSTTAFDITAIGSFSLQSLTTGNLNVGIGSSAGQSLTTGSKNILIGAFAGDSTAINATGHFVAGSSTAPINSLWFGNGESNASPQNIAINSTAGSGTNIAGASLTMAGGIGTGTGAGGSVIIQTAKAGSTGSTPNTLVTALTIDQNANIVMGTAALATTATNGFLYIETCAGAPTGTPTSFTGRVALVFDTTNNKIWVYNGAWKGAVVS